MTLPGTVRQGKWSGQCQGYPGDRVGRIVGQPPELVSSLIQKTLCNGISAIHWNTYPRYKIRCL
jgi:hypothetical protein